MIFMDKEDVSAYVELAMKNLFLQNFKEKM